MTSRWWSQPFAPEGSAAAEGIVKQLGRPQLDPLTVLVREAAQNSWDARTGEDQVEFAIGLETFGPREGAWRGLLLPGPAAAADVPLDVVLRADSYLVTISDRGTRGLGGPLRAGARPAAGEKADFVQFLRNVGEPNDNAFGGGTYGFGKGIFYRLSRASAILVDTMTPTGERRLMGAALGNSWYQDDVRFTGRHWWADIASDEIPDPFRGADAAQLAADLGLPGFSDGRSGTDIVLLGADLGTTEDESGEARERTIGQAADYLASSMLWNLWPKSTGQGRAAPMRLEVRVDGRLIELPDPLDVPDLQPFVQALNKIRAGDHEMYRRTVAPKVAGKLALGLGAATDRPSRFDAMVAAARPFDGPSHHVARMRVAELVVDYLPTSPHPDPLLRYAGVFQTSVDSDAVFASAEPPTHDDWVEKGLSGTARGVVQGARLFVHRTVDAFLGLSSAVSGGQGKGLGALSSRLASLLPAIDGGGAGQVGGGGRGGPGGSGTRGGTNPRIIEGPRLEHYRDSLYLVAKVHVPKSPIQRKVRAEVAVVVEGGGRESDPPAGAATPTVTGWRADDGSGIDGDVLTVEANGGTDWWVFSTHVPDAMVRFRLTDGSTDAR